MSTRKNGKRGFLCGNSPNLKESSTSTTRLSNTQPLHGRRIQSPNPIAVHWYNSVNSASNSTDVCSTSPSNQNSIHNLAKFSPPKYGYGNSAKWSTSAAHPSYGALANTDKYHWFNSTNTTIKA